MNKGSGGLHGTDVRKSRKRRENSKTRMPLLQCLKVKRNKGNKSISKRREVKIWSTVQSFAADLPDHHHHPPSFLLPLSLSRPPFLLQLSHQGQEDLLADPFAERQEHHSAKESTKRSNQDRHQSRCMWNLQKAGKSETRTSQTWASHKIERHFCDSS